jgi:hypothetical protein
MGDPQKPVGNARCRQFSDEFFAARDCLFVNWRLLDRSIHACLTEINLFVPSSE